MVSYISLFFHAFLVGQYKGARGPSYAIPFHHPCGHFDVECIVRLYGPSRTIGYLRQNLASPNIFGRSKQQLSAGFDRSSEPIILHFVSFWMSLLRLPILVWSGVQIQICSPAASVLANFAIGNPGKLLQLLSINLPRSEKDVESLFLINENDCRRIRDLYACLRSRLITFYPRLQHIIPVY